jgi:prepilin-type N-terminal cleavage/methylation domain-containing protein
MRRGFSLIEILVVIAGASVVFTVLAVSLYTLSRAQSAVQDESHTAAALHAFAQQLREDAHAAAEAGLTEANEAGDATPALMLRFDDASGIVYDFPGEPSAIRRRVMRDETTATRESYVLPRGARVAWELAGDGAARVVAIVSRPAGPSANPSWRTTRIEAAVGLNRIELP